MAQKRQEIEEDELLMREERRVIQMIMKRDRSESLEDIKDIRRGQVDFAQTTKTMRQQIREKTQLMHTLKDRVSVRKLKERSPKIAKKN